MSDVTVIDLNPTIVEDLCQKCRLRVATENWTGDGGVIGFIHGAYQRWCEMCCLEAQLKHCREAAARIPEIESRLAELQAVDSGSTPY